MVVVGTEESVAQYLERFDCTFGGGDCVIVGGVTAPDEDLGCGGAGEEVFSGEGEGEHGGVGVQGSDAAVSRGWLWK